MLEYLKFLWFKLVWGQMTWQRWKEVAAWMDEWENIRTANWRRAEMLRQHNDEVERYRKAMGRPL